jgi:hypothetical protein
LFNSYLYIVNKRLINIWPGGSDEDQSGKIGWVDGLFRFHDHLSPFLSELIRAGNKQR